MPSAPVAMVGTTLLGQRSARKAQSAASDAASREAELAYQRSLPWDVQGAFGGAEFDEEGRRLDLSLSEPWQAEYDLAMAGAEKQRRCAEWRRFWLTYQRFYFLITFSCS